MKTKLKRSNTKRLASLSALGAGALGAAAVPAHASDVVFSGVIDVTVEFPASHSYTIPGPGPGGAGGVIFTHISSGCQITCFNIGFTIGIASKPGKYGTQFRFLATGKDNSFAQGQPQGAVWGTAPGKSTKSADIIYTYGGHPSTTITPTDRYLLFRFQRGALKHDIYGWARIHLPDPNHAEVEIVDWAYDPSGVRLPAGYHGGGRREPEDLGAIEPSSIDATGRPALALGAPALRRWRAARKAEAANAAASAPQN